MLQPALRVIGGRHNGKQIPITGKKFLIGREEDCHLRPNSDMVSRHHCVFTVDEYSVRLRDFGSTNGTSVNGQRIKGEVQLNHEDKIQVGKLDFEILIKKSTDVESSQIDPQIVADAPSSGEILTGSDTVFDIPVHLTDDSQTPPPAVPEVTTPAPEATPAPEVYNGDTQILSAEQQAQQAGYPPQQYPYPPQQMPPGQPMPPGQQYPYQMPPQYYPQQGYPQQPMPAYPQQYQVPPQGYPQQQPPQEENEPAAPELPPVTLPPPEETGVKNQE